jgi:hypothetical protein
LYIIILTFKQNTKMLTCILKGGLGNQLFQIFTTIAYSFRVKNPFIFSYVETITGETPRPTYWTTLLKCLYKYTNVDGLIPNNILESFYKYKGDHGYTEIPSQFMPLETEHGYSHNICLDGFFQSYKYFKNEYSRIYELLDIDGLKMETNFPDRLPNQQHQQTISLHFRVGDYASKQCYHPVLPILYYERALQHISNVSNQNQNPTNYRVYVFFEQKDIDYVKNAIEQLRPVIPDATFELVNEPTDWKQMILMSKCDHHIIANSTFSWWGATFSMPHILNRESGHSSSKIVCYPSIWYGHQLYYINTLDLFPDVWTKISFLESEMDKSYCNCFLKK